MIKGYLGVGGFYRREFVDKIYSRFLTVHRSVNYTKVKHLVGISKKCVFIQSSYNINGSVVEIYKVEELDFKNKKVILRKVATFKEEKWDNISYLNNYKVGIHSTLMRAKKFYSLMDLD